MSQMGHKATKSARPKDFCFLIPKPTSLANKSFCAAAIGSNVAFLIRKRTFPELAANGCFWPDLALGGEGLNPTRNSHPRWRMWTSVIKSEVDVLVVLPERQQLAKLRHAIIPLQAFE